MISLFDRITHVVILGENSRSPGSQRDENPRVTSLPDNLAYLNYTSGTTGVPKAVLVSHIGVVRLVHEPNYVRLDACSRLLQMAPLSFDAATFEIWGALLNGGTLVIMPPGPHSPQEIGEVLVRHRVDTLWLTAGLFNAVVSSALPSLGGVRQLLAGGDVLSADHVEQVLRAHPNCQVINGYGPTENTTFTCCYPVPPLADLHAGVPIGFPINGTRVYVLDESLEPVPVGGTGELYTAGLGLARGYLNRPALTAERFVADPRATYHGQRMYRTGDLARVRADGSLDFLGRVDHQVKIRGFRIELGEIEAALAAHPAVAQAAVIARDDGPGGKKLVAYVVAAREAVSDTAALTQHVAERLPEYMVPSAIVVLDALPLTSNGKLDQRALPTPERRLAGYRAPRSPEETALCGLFAEVLALEGVGIDDNFFELGGDSIQAILLVGRACRTGLGLTPRDVFQYKTVAALVAVAQAPKAAAQFRWDADAAVGVLSPTPYMCRLLEGAGPSGRFSQSMLLRVPEDLVERDLVMALQAILDRHDVLRLRLERDDEGHWILRIPMRGTVSATSCLTRVDVGGIDEVARNECLRAAAWDAESRLGAHAGSMLHATWLVGEGAGNVLLVINGLVVDAASWQILVRDLETALNQAARGRAPVLSSSGTPFRAWAQDLAERARLPSLIAELPTWEAIHAAGTPLLPDAKLDPIRDTLASAGRLRVIFGTATTTALLTAVPAAFHARIDDVLLTALAVAVADWRRGRETARAGSIVVDLEQQGRETTTDGIDLSQTVGQFTWVFPVSLDVGELDIDLALAGGPALGGMFKRVKEQVRAVPEGGIGYELLRYTHPETGSPLASQVQPQLGLSYLGRFAADINVDWSLSGPPGRLVGGMDPATPLAHLLEISAITTDNDPEGPRLSATWIWAGSHFDEADVRALADGWQRLLEALVRHVEQPRAGGHTPSDFPLTRLSQAQVEQLEVACPGLEDILPLAPLQEGLLFHALHDDTGQDVYNVQIVMEFEGDLDISRLRCAAEALLRRHANLRVAFHYEGLARPVQVIARQVKLPWRERDLSTLEGEVQKAALEQLLATDWSERFVPRAAPLLRWTLVRLRPERHLLLFTSHHVLVDGWSLPVFFGELLDIYRGDGKSDTLPRVRPYADYLEWLARQDRTAALAGWRDYLAGFEVPTRLCPSRDRSGPLAAPERWRADLPTELTSNLQAMARSRGLTLNTVVQGLWGVLLGRLTGRDDVVFGVTVSGRPAELAGVERMVGLFINTVPLRVRLCPGETLAGLLAGVQQSQSLVLGFHHAGLADIQRAVGAGELFDTLLVFENFPEDRAASAQAMAGPRVTWLEGQDATHYPLSLMVVPGERLHCALTTTRCASPGRRPK